MNFHDITERKLADEKKDEFISIASHELKSPLSSLKSYLQFLQKKYHRKDERLDVTLSKMGRQIEKMTSLIETLLDVTKMQEGKIKLQKKKTLFSSLIRSVIEDTPHTTHKITPRSLTNKYLYIDESRIAQVLQNLLSNAMKYSPTGSRITIWNTEKDDLIYTHIKDQGQGIAKENLVKIFERFFQEDKPSDHQGLGLGLYISSTIIKLHGGQMDASSKEGSGSVFTFSLPTNRKKRKL